MDSRQQTVKIRCQTAVHAHDMELLLQLLMELLPEHPLSSPRSFRLHSLDNTNLIISEHGSLTHSHTATPHLTPVLPTTACLVSHNWLHTPDCKVLNEMKTQLAPQPLQEASLLYSMLLLIMHHAQTPLASAV